MMMFDDAKEEEEQEALNNARTASATCLAAPVCSSEGEECSSGSRSSSNDGGNSDEESASDSDGDSLPWKGFSAKKSAAAATTPKSGGSGPLTVVFQDRAKDHAADESGSCIRRDRKLFMSSRVADLDKLGMTKVKTRAELEEEKEDEMHSKQLLAWIKEAEKFSASHMDSKSKRKWDMKQLEELGAKDKANGFLRLKGTGATKRRARALQARHEDKGLNASEGRFKNGVLHVSDRNTKRDRETAMEGVRGKTRKRQRGGGGDDLGPSPGGMRKGGKAKKRSSKNKKAGGKKRRR
ncbi:hypothetical protein CBR_g17154 [Chara braunii]|uniref:Uncharacterized protein n=1 Tax=Chara braunii TaxID=69332 RepID=A0A388KUT5_CHABU|nr:hypothetical protein CBR_g17154 [Chara braunii]|eukprot:GBG73816.1 hypothetical protein CBR_g17154 [Chara braunii]